MMCILNTTDRGYGPYSILRQALLESSLKMEVPYSALLVTGNQDACGNVSVLVRTTTS